MAIKKPIPKDIVLLVPGINKSCHGPIVYDPTKAPQLNAMFDDHGPFFWDLDHYQDMPGYIPIEGRKSRGQSKLVANDVGIIATECEWTDEGEQLISKGEYNNFSINCWKDLNTNEFISLTNIALCNLPADPKAHLDRSPDKVQAQKVMNSATGQLADAESGNVTGSLHNQHNYDSQESIGIESEDNMAKKTIKNTKCEADDKKVEPTVTVTEQPTDVKQETDDGSDASDDTDMDNDADVEEETLEDVKAERDALKEQVAQLSDAVKAAKQKQEDAKAMQEDEDTIAKRKLTANMSDAQKAYWCSPKRSVDQLKEYIETVTPGVANTGRVKLTQSKVKEPNPSDAVNGVETSEIVELAKSKLSCKDAYADAVAARAAEIKSKGWVSKRSIMIGE